LAQIGPRGKRQHSPPNLGQRRDKQRFGALTHELGLSESALLKRSVNLMLSSTRVSLPVTEVAGEVPRNLRLSVQLRRRSHAPARPRGKPQHSRSNLRVDAAARAVGQSA
jgi:hypothetical protein